MNGIDRLDWRVKMEKDSNHPTNLICPFCGFRQVVEISVESPSRARHSPSLPSHHCANCNLLIKPAPGDCCVLCSYGESVHWADI